MKPGTRDAAIAIAIALAAILYISLGLPKGQPW